MTVLHVIEDCHYRYLSASFHGCLRRRSHFCCSFQDFLYKQPGCPSGELQRVLAVQHSILDSKVWSICQRQNVVQCRLSYSISSLLLIHSLGACLHLNQHIRNVVCTRLSCIQKMIHRNINHKQVRLCSSSKCVRLSRLLAFECILNHCIFINSFILLPIRKRDWRAGMSSWVGKSHAGAYLTTVALACKYLTTPATATTVPCERLSSASSSTVSKKRASLSPGNVNKLVCLNNWLRDRDKSDLRQLQLTRTMLNEQFCFSELWSMLSVVMKISN